jgi:death-on-curing protein
VKFLSYEQVVAMHAELLKRWGGAEGGGHRGVGHEGVEAAVQAVKNSYYESKEELAAAYAVYIIQGHVFLDGNKRTGAAAMLTFLLANGGRTLRSSNELARAMVELQSRAEAGERTDQLVSWLATLVSR